MEYKSEIFLKDFFFFFFKLKLSSGSLFLSLFSGWWYQNRASFVPRAQLKQTREKGQPTLVIYGWIVIQMHLKVVSCHIWSKNSADHCSPYEVIAMERNESLIGPERKKKSEPARMCVLFRGEKYVLLFSKDKIFFLCRCWRLPI